MLKIECAVIHGIIEFLNLTNTKAKTSAIRK